MWHGACSSNPKTIVDSLITYERKSLKRYKRGSWYLYIIRTHEPWNPYIGITPNPVRRFREHVEGKGSYITRKYGVRYMHVLARYPRYKMARLAERKAHIELGVAGYKAEHGKSRK